jgi:hypothetical protein
MLQRTEATEPLERPWPQLAVDTLANGYWQDAENEFVRFRKLMRPRMITGWWADEIAEALQQFYEDLSAGKRPNLAIGAPRSMGRAGRRLISLPG